MAATLLSRRQAQANLGFPLQHYLVCAEQRLICCAIPKNGCTTLKRWFLAFAEPASRDASDVHARCAARWAISLWEGPERDLALRDYTRVAFIRDPLARVASAFIEKFAGGHPYGCFEPAREVMEDVGRLAGRPVPLDQSATIMIGGRELAVPASSDIDYQRGITFREFVHYLCRAPDHHLDVHWVPQARYLWDQPFDLIATVADLTGVLSALSAERSLPPPPHTEALPRDALRDGCLADIPSGELYQLFHAERGCLPPAQALYDDDLRMLIACRYALDLDLYRSASDRRAPGYQPCGVIVSPAGSAARQ